MDNYWRKPTFFIRIHPLKYVGAVLRAANQNQLIAGGNHTMISSANLSPATLQLQPVRLNGITQCSGGNLPPYTLYI